MAHAAYGSTVARLASAWRRLAGARPRALLLAAAALHLCVAAAVFLAGRLALLGNLFDADGIGRFADDGLIYQRQARTLVSLMREGSWAAWWDAPFGAHVKIYSLSFLLFEPLFGYTILAVEPLNLAFYLATLCLVYSVGALAFGRRTGLASAAMVALWPSLLLHSTQLIKDPSYIAASLAVVALCVALLERKMSTARGLLAGAAGAAALLLLSRLKSNVWEMSLLLIVLAVAALVAPGLKRTRGGAGNYLCAAMLLAAVLVAPVRMTPPRARADMLAASADSRTNPVWASIGSRIASRRHGFIVRYGQATSNIDTGVWFDDTDDLVRYLPRAALVGLFAPFPVMWFDASAGTGLAARLLSGAETLCFYALAVLAAYAAWRGRRRAAVWLLLGWAVAGCVTLALIVVNVGALFRLRYIFWVLILVVAVSGAESLAKRHTRRG